MNRHGVYAALEHSDLQLAHFLRIAWSLVANVHKELEAAEGDSTAVAKCKSSAKNTKICTKGAGNY